METRCFCKFEVAGRTDQALNIKGGAIEGHDGHFEMLHPWSLGEVG